MSVSIAIVPLQPGASLDRDAIVANLQHFWPQMPELKEGDDEGDDGEDQDSDIIFLSTDEAHLVFAPMPAPIPEEDTQFALEGTYLWPTAADAIAGHDRHVIVTVMSDVAPADRLRMLTVATGALLESSAEAPGAFWCDAHMFVSKELVIEFAKEVMPDMVALPLWINFRAGSGPEGKNVGCTNGLKALGLMEIETLNSPEPIGELRERLIGLADYLIENGPVIRDGDTVGESATERIKVVYRPSEFGNEGQVMRLDYEFREKKPSFLQRLMGRRDRNP